MPIDIMPIVARANEEGGYSVGRPQIARAMIAAGYVADTREAFDRWLAARRPAFVARAAASPEHVIGVIHAAGGVASLAHPGQTGVDARLAVYRDSGLDALEAFHPDHDKPSTDRYRDVATRLNVLVTGGSDFHGDPSHGWEPGAVSLPADEWRRLRSAASRA
jgi:predicted metal-dependent phosphoesterase TrpH